MVSVGGEYREGRVGVEGHKFMRLAWLESLGSLMGMS